MLIFIALFLNFMIFQTEKWPILKSLLKKSTKFIECISIFHFFHIYRRIMYNFNDIP